MANVGLSTTLAQALSIIAFYIVSLFTATPIPDTVQVAVVTVISIVIGYFIHATTGPDGQPLTQVIFGRKIPHEARTQASPPQSSAALAGPLHTGDVPRPAATSL